MLLAWAAGRPAARRPNVLLITLDTVRADRLGCYGGAPGTSPHLDRLAREGVLFERARAPMPMTRPSHASLFTSQAPRRHGVVYNARTLPADRPTLAETLRAAGYRTAAFLSVWLLDERSGLTRGFDAVSTPAGQERIAPETAAAVLAWLGSAADDTPFLLWMHLFDAHTPYAPPAAFAPETSSDEARHLPVADWGRLGVVAEAHGGDLPAPYLARAQALYDGEIRAVDAAVGAVIAALRDRGWLDATLIVVTADHGECFEHGIYFQHSTCLYEGAVRIPLLLRYPPALPAGMRRGEVAESVDVAPTVLALLDLPRPDSFEGVSLVDGPRPRAIVVQHPEPPPDNVERRRRDFSGVRSVAGVAARAWGSGIGQHAVIDGDWKAILGPDTAELYDLAADPGETRDLAAAHPERLAAARARLAAWQRGAAAAPDGEALDPATRERLRALGY